MMNSMNSITNIEEYYNWLIANPKKANKKVVAVYKKLVDDIHNKKTVQYINKETGEVETNTYIFQREKGQRVIDFIEKFCHHSKGKWAGKPIKLELFQRALLEATFGFVNEETGLRKYKKVIFKI